MPTRAALLPLLACALAGADLGGDLGDAMGLLKDAETYLMTLGVPPGLPMLPVQYGGIVVQGAFSQFDATRDARLLGSAPTVEWDPLLGDKASPKFALLMVDPDAPSRVGDGSAPGSAGPWLHWLLLNCKTTAESGYALSWYTKPEPPVGNHRYIFLLLEQIAPGTPPKSFDRKAWDLAGFLQGNADKLRPVAVNFFYASAPKGKEEL